MKKVVFLLVIAFTAFMFISGCSQPQDTPDATVSETDSAAVEIAQVTVEDVQGMTDIAMLENIALDHADSEVRQAALDQISKFSTEVERIQNITDIAELKNIAIEHDDKIVRKAALDRMTKLSAQAEEGTVSEPEVIIEDPVAIICTKYTAGEKDKIRYSKNTLNRVWVEMQGKEPSETGRRTTELEYIISREVQDVDGQGTATIKLTFDEVKLTLASNVQKKTKENSYISTPEKTTSTWKGEPGVAGKSVTVKVGKDGTIHELLDHDKLLEELHVTVDDNSRVSYLIGEESVRNIIERPFIKACEGGQVLPSGWDAYQEIPDAMLNAKAMRMIYVPDNFTEGDNILNVKTSIEPLYTVPEGMPEPPAAGDPFKMILKQNSDLQEPKVISEAVFDIEKGQVLKDLLDVEYLMILDGNQLFPEQRTGKKKDVDAGMMYTLIKINEEYEVIE